MLRKFTSKNEASGNSAEFCFDKWPHWLRWQTLTVLTNGQSTAVLLAGSADSSHHCLYLLLLPLSCCPTGEMCVSSLICSRQNKKGKIVLRISTAYWFHFILFFTSTKVSHPYRPQGPPGRDEEGDRTCRSEWQREVKPKGGLFVKIQLSLWRCPRARSTLLQKWTNAGIAFCYAK